MNAFFTILTSALNLTKTFEKTESGLNAFFYGDGQKGAKHFDFSSKVVTSFEELYFLICELSAQKQSCIIRNELIEGINPHHTRRLIHPKKDSPATCKNVDRSWICWDQDTARTPFEVDPQDRSDLERAARWLVEQMPAPFSHTNCVVQFSSSAFLAEDGGVDPHKAKAHLWYLLDSEVCNQSLVDFAKAHGIDAATARGVQPNYTATPIFKGMADPLCKRVFKVAGLEDEAPVAACQPALYDERSLAEATAKREADRQKALEEAKKRAPSIADAKDASKVVAAACDDIRYAGQGGRHDTIFSKSAWVGSLVSGGYVDEYSARAELESAVSAVFPPSNPRHKDEIRCMNDGFAHGMSKPAHLIDRKLTKKAKKAAKRSKKITEQPQVSSMENLAPIEDVVEHHAPVEKVKMIQRFAKYSDAQKGKEQGDRWCPSLPDGRLVCVNASLGTGKTEQIIRQITLNPDLKVLWIDHRIALSQDTMHRLHGLNFVLYLDSPTGNLNYSRMVVCADSLWRVSRSDFDLVVIDEADQTLFSFFKKGTDTSSIITRLSVLEGLFLNSKQIVLLSADLDQQTAEAYAKLAHLTPPDITWHHHRWIAPGSSWRFVAEMSRWKALLLDAWSKGEKVAIFCASRKELETLVKLLQKKRPEAAILAIHSECKDAHRKTLEDVNTTWLGYDAVIYTTSAGAGVSFDVENYFDRVFVWGHHQSNSFPASEYRQGAARVRSPKNREVIAYVPETWRKRLSREEILDDQRAYERETLNLMRSLVPFECCGGRFVRSQNHPLIVQVWLDYMEIREERTVAQCHWLLKSLLDDHVRIVCDDTTPPKPQKKAISKDSAEAREKAKEERAIAICDAPTITYKEAEELEGADCNYEQMRSLQKHHLGAFYQGDVAPEPTDVAPKTTVTLVLEDNEGEKRAQLRRCVNATVVELCPEYYAHLDASEGITTDTPETVKANQRSAPDARHHTLKAQSTAKLIAIMNVCVPGLKSVLDAWTNKQEMPSLEALPTASLEDPQVRAAIAQIFELPLPLLGIRGLSSEAEPEKIIGDVLRYFGIKRQCCQLRLPDKSRKRVYHISVEELWGHLALGNRERDRVQAATLKWLEGAVPLMRGTVTPLRERVA